MSLHRLDQTDIAILNLLQKDGLMTQKELSHKLHKSQTSIVERIRKLKQEGYISKTVALIDIQKIRSVFIAFPHVQLTHHSEEAIRDFQDQTMLLPEVMECYHLTGHYDFMLKIIVPDMVSYNQFLRDKLGKLRYVGNIQSFLVLSQGKFDTAYPL